MAGGCSAHVNGNVASFDYRFATGYGPANVDGSAYLHATASGFDFVGTMGWTGALDLSIAATTTDQAVNADITMNSASAVGVGVDATAVQLTTARTSGYLGAFRAKTTSLAGDLNGVIYAGLYCLAPTDGGGAAVHVGLYDAGNDYAVIAADGVKIGWGTGTANVPDISIAWDGTSLKVSQLTANSAIEWGVDGAGIDHVFYGDTANAKFTWDQSADAWVTGGRASIRGLRTSGAADPNIGGATVLTLDDSGGVFSVNQGAGAFDIDLPSPTTGPGCRYVFVVTAAGANNVTITVTGGAATYIGTIVNDVTSVLPATGNTLTFVTGTAAIGDTIEIISLSTSLYLVRAVSSAAGGITIA